MQVLLFDEIKHTAKDAFVIKINLAAAQVEQRQTLSMWWISVSLAGGQYSWKSYSKIFRENCLM